MLRNQAMVLCAIISFVGSIGQAQIVSLTNLREVFYEIADDNHLLPVEDSVEDFDDIIVVNANGVDMFASAMSETTHPIRRRMTLSAPNGLNIFNESYMAPNFFDSVLVGTASPTDDLVIQFDSSDGFVDMVGIDLVALSAGNLACTVKFKDNSGVNQTETTNVALSQQPGQGYFSGHIGYNSIELVNMPRSEITEIIIAGGGNTVCVDNILYRVVGCTLDHDFDGVVEFSLLSVLPFRDLLTTGQYNLAYDLNGDGEINLLDVAPFVWEIISGGGRNCD